MAIGKASSMNALYSMKRSMNEHNNTMQQLATGNKLNRASNGPSEVAIAAELQAQSNGLNQALQNVQDTGNMIQTADAAMGNIQNVLQENRDLGVRAANSATLTAQDQGRIDQQYQANLAEVDRSANAANFNTKQILDGSYGTQSAQVGPGAGPENQIDITLNATDTANIGAAGTSVTNTGNAQAAITASDAAINTVSNQRSDAGVTQRRLQSVESDLMNQDVNITAAKSRLTDVNFAEAASKEKSQGLRVQLANWAAKKSNQLGAMASTFA